MKKRKSYFDNLKGFLIMLVVLGHLLEQAGLESSGFYKLIYSFHMPLFVFVSGYFSKFSAKKILEQLLIPYIIVQLICCVITQQKISFITPYWILWYLFALAIWKMTLPFLELFDKKMFVFLIVMAMVAACSAGYDPTIGYNRNTSRLLVFYPYFLMGVYCQRIEFEEIINRLKENKVFRSLLRVICVLIVLYFMLDHQMKYQWFYGSYSYESQNYTFLFRIFYYLVSIVLSSFVMIEMPKSPTFFTSFGFYSFEIYLTHILFVWVMKIIARSISSEVGRLLLCLGYSFVLCEIIERIFFKWGRKLFKS